MKGSLTRTFTPADALREKTWGTGFSPETFGYQALSVSHGVLQRQQERLQRTAAGFSTRCVASRGEAMQRKQHSRRVGPWSKLTYDTNLGGYRTDITEEQLRGAPSFYRERDYDWSDRRREQELQDYWRAPYYWSPA